MIAAVESLVQPVDWLAVAPPLTVALTAILVLLLDAFGRLPTGLRRAVSVAGLLVAAFWLFPLRGEARGVFCVADDPAACSFVADDTTLVFALVALGAAALVLLLPVDGREPSGEYHFLLLTSVVGATTIAGARDLITLVVALELVSLPAFALVGLRAGASRRAAEAAVKFFLISVVSIAVMLFGLSLVYGATGAVHYSRVAAALDDGTAEAYGSVAGVGLALTLVGLAFKVAAVPFHLWVPDTYVGASVPIAAYLSVVSKAAGFVGLIGLVGFAFGPRGDVWGPVVAAFAALTMTVGNLGALRQRHAVRLLAWSSIAQSGYMLVPLAAAAGAPDDAGTVLAATAAYVLIYAMMNLGAFAVVSARTAMGLDDFRGLVRTNPALGLPLAFFLLCLAGLPPGVIGLFAKLVVIRAAVDGGAGWLAVVMAVNIAIGLAYYLYWAALLVGPPAKAAEPVEAAPVAAVGSAEPALAGSPGGNPEATPVVEQSTRISVPLGVVVGVTLGLTVVLSVLPGVVLDILNLSILP